MTKVGRPSTLPDDETIRKLYWDQKLRPVEIAAMYGVTLPTLKGRMKRSGIPLRSKSEGVRLSHERTGRKERESSLADVLRCCHCCWVWRRDTEKESIPCPKCGMAKDCRVRRYTRRHGGSEVLKKLNATRDYKKQYAKLRTSVLLVVGRGKVACANCGCDKPECLEVNHINGGGNKEMNYGTNSTRFYWRIVRLQRAVDDLNILCKVCNALHALEMKLGKLPFEVTYHGVKDHPR